VNYLEFSRILVILGSAATTFGLYAQAFKLWKIRSARDFSGILIVSVVVNEVVWLNYGFSLSEWDVLWGRFSNTHVLTIFLS